MKQPPTDQLQQALRETHRQYQSLVAQSDDAIYIFQDGCFVFVNSAWERLLGYEKEEALGAGFDYMRSVVAPASRPLMQDRSQRHENGEPLSDRFQFQARTRQGRLLTIDARRTGVTWNGARATQGIYKAVTERYETRRALQESEERWRRLVESHPDAIVVIEGPNLVYANETTADLLGAASPRDLMGRDVRDFIVPGDHAKFTERNERISQGEELPPASYRAQGPGGKQIEVEVYVKRIRYEGRPAHQAVVRDVTERRRRERKQRARTERLHQQQNALTRLTNQQTDAAGSFEATFAHITEVLARTLGIARASIWLYEDDHAAIRCLDRYDRDQGTHTSGERHDLSDHFEYAHNPKTRRALTFPDAQTDERLRAFRSYFQKEQVTSVLVVPLLVEGKIIGVMVHEHRGTPRTWTTDEKHFAGSVADLAALALESRRRRRTEQALRVAENKFRSLVEQSVMGVYIISESGIEYVNPCFADVFGRTVDAVMQIEDLDELVALPDRKKVLRSIRKQLSGEWPSNHYRFRGLRKDGRTVHVEAHGKHTEYEGKAAIIGTLVDITSRIESEQALRESQELLSAINENVTEAIYRSKQSGGLVYVNRAFAQAFGYDSVEEVLSTPATSLYKDPDERERLYARLQEAGVVRNEEVEFRRRDGSTFWGLLNSRSILGENGETTHWDGAITDITERKKRERELVAAKEEAEKMNRLKSTFLANMSHEIRTPLTSIIGFADVLAGELDNEQQRELVGMIRQSGNRLMETLNSVLRLSQLEGGSLNLSVQPFDVAAIVSETVPAFQPQAVQKDLTLSVENGSAEPLTALLDRGAFHRVLANLITNAIKFTEARGSVTVSTTGNEDTVRVSVKDTGIGIEPSFQKEIFEEFKQESSGLSREHEGSGLGLAITKKLVERMDGRMTVESTKGQGSTFTAIFSRLNE